MSVALIVLPSAAIAMFAPAISSSCFQLRSCLRSVLSAKSFISKSDAVWSPVFVQLVSASLSISSAVVYLFVACESSMSSVFNTTAHASQFTLVTWLCTGASLSQTISNLPVKGFINCLIFGVVMY